MHMKLYYCTQIYTIGIICLPQILMHEAEVISTIGQTSEKTADASNKHFRQFGLNFAGKF